MPRSTRTSSTASDGAASSSAAGGGEETTDGANRKKLTSQEKDKVREQKKSFSKSMYAMAVAYLKNTLESIKTEGRGDVLVAHHYGRLRGQRSRAREAGER